MSTLREIFVETLNFGSVLKPPSFILNVIERGYLLLLVSFPEPAVFNNRSSLSYAEFVEEAIQDLVESGRAFETKEGTDPGCQHLVCIFSN